MNVEIEPRGGPGSSFVANFDKYTIHSQKRLCLGVFSAYCGEMDVKIHELWISIDTKTCFAKNYERTNYDRAGVEDFSSSRATRFL